MSWMQYGNFKYEIGSTEVPSANLGYGHPTAMCVANSLAKLNRFTGHSERPYSVASHSIYVADLLAADPLDALYGLVHDVAETVVQDLSQPLKAALGPDGLSAYKRVEQAAEQMLYEVLRVPYPVPDAIRARVKRADCIAVASEKEQLMPLCSTEWDMPYPASHLPLPNHALWLDARDAWVRRYNELMTRCKDARRLK